LIFDSDKSKFFVSNIQIFFFKTFTYKRKMNRISVLSKTAVRGFATKSAAKQQPPKKLHGVHGRYATALFNAASNVCLF
jgi:hypothetical protein